jgi:hypothetical protein
MARQEYYYGRQFSADEIIAAIDAVTLDDVLHVAETIVDPESLSLTVLGNVKRNKVLQELVRMTVTSNGSVEKVGRPPDGKPVTLQPAARPPTPDSGAEQAGAK